MIIFSGFAVDERTLEELEKLSGVPEADDNFFFLNPHFEPSASK